MNEPAIRLENLTKTYPGGVEALKGIDISVQPGEVFGLVGPNGAGKSTTVGVLTTTITPSSGSVRLGGFDVIEEPEAARRTSAVVFQDPVVDRPLSGRRNLQIHGRLWGVNDEVAERRIDALAAVFELSELLERPVASYSGGQRRRLEIARALVSEPSVLFLDEPTVGLDPRIRRELLDLIGGLRDRSELTIFLTTHYLDEAERICDRIAIIHSGEIVAADSPAALVGALGDQLMQLRVDADPSAVLAGLRRDGVAGEDAFIVGSSLTVPLHGRPGADVTASLDRMRATASAIATRVPTLDDVYLKLTGVNLGEAA
jgi:ABC-2 type transport system ATP-binding protein